MDAHRTDAHRPAGMAAFTVIWSGQLVSAVGTRMTNFALGVWVWQQSNSASDLALMTVFAFGATVVASPIAGSLVDRWNRRLTVIMSDLGSGVATLGALLLFATGTASLWPLIAVNTVMGAFLAFQYPAIAATITTMVAKEQYPRANAMLSMARSIPAIFAFLAAGALLSVASIETIIVLDVLSYVVGIGTVFLVALPEVGRGSGAATRSFLPNLLAGFRVLGSDRGLVGLQAVLFVISLVSAVGFIVITPMVLVHTGSEWQLGMVNTVGAVGGVLGALVVSAVRPPHRKVLWILAFVLAFSLGRVAMGAGDTLVVWSAAWLFSWLCVPFIEAYSQSVWQQKTDPAVQGRLFGAIQLLSQLGFVVGFTVTGPLVDRVFEPLMRPGATLAQLFGSLTGVGPGAGMRLVFILSGVAGAVAGLAGLLNRTVRDLEVRVADYEAMTIPETRAHEPVR